MPKRVSLKGKGADIFFGDYHPAADPVDAPAEAMVAAKAAPPPTDEAPPVRSAPASTRTSRPRPARPGTLAPPVDGQSTRQSTDQSTNRPTSRPVKLSDDQWADQIVDRPKAFYITQRLDRQLDDAVRYLQQEHGLRKVDRSVLLNTLLDHEEIWTDAALDALVDQVVRQLTSRLTGRPTGR